LRTIAHISDVHFGREDPAIVAGLLQSVAEVTPDIIVVSGDLTQRARKKQFRAARAFLDDLPHVPQIVIPGNHDISLTSLTDRAFKPFKRFKRYITADLEPYLEDEEVAISGINTVRKSTVNNGRIKARQVKIACEQLSRAGEHRARIVVTHHPMDIKLEDRRRLVSRSKAAMKQFVGCGVDLFLSGHLHTGSTVATSARYKIKGYSAVVVQAGTAVSTRLRRGEPNAWNIVRVDGVGPASGSIEIQPMHWDKKKFKPMGIERYLKRENGWVLEDSKR
jgi:3',5'-cyclic AMP phosphodiesterase CpdA